MSTLKKQLRQEILNKRRCLGAECILDESTSIAKHLCAWPTYLAAKTVMLFMSMPDEPQMNEVIEHAWAHGKRVCIPHTREDYGLMDAAEIGSFDDLVVGQFDILVPDPAKLKIVEPGDIDLIVVPGVAFECTGERCGMGAGYYDRFLKQANKALLIGVSLACQIVPNVPTDEHDYLVQYIVTHDGIINCKTGQV
jgi:5-formyltetrahydrofolate cyclo-ligase